MSQSLYEKYGGFSTVSRIVMDFYDQLLDSERVGDFFENTDMNRLIDHQTKFIAYLLGGPADYTGDRLRQSHSGLGIADDDFDEMVSILLATLRKHGMDEADIATVAAKIEARRALVVAS